MQCTYFFDWIAWFSMILISKKISIFVVFVKNRWNLFREQLYSLNLKLQNFVQSNSIFYGIAVSKPIFTRKYKFVFVRFVCTMSNVLLQSAKNEFGLLLKIKTNEIFVYDSGYVHHMRMFILSSHVLCVWWKMFYVQSNRKWEFSLCIGQINKTWMKEIGLKIFLDLFWKTVELLLLKSEL